MALNDLDVKDRKILLALDTKGRGTDTQIGKIVGLSKQLTNYRIKRLESKGIIKSYYPIIDHTKLGLKLFKIVLKLENTNIEKEKEILSYLKKHTSWLATILGNWDLAMGIYVNDEYQFKKFWDTFYEKYSYYIENKWITLMTKFLNYERSFLYPSNAKRSKQFIIGKNPEMISLNKIDKDIINELSKNAKQTSLNLAKNIKQTERVVRYRIKELEKKQIILGYRANIDFSKLGLKFYKLFIDLKNTQAKDLTKIHAYFKNENNVAYSTEAIGGADLEIETYFNNSKELFDFIVKAKETFPEFMKTITFLEYMQEHKVTYFT